jgi:hypothetical protein
MRAPHSYLKSFFVVKEGMSILITGKNKNKHHIVYRLMINVYILSTNNYGR